MRIAGVIFVTALPAWTQVCDPPKFQGVYGFQLSGTTTISGDTKPVASMGRLEFDGQGGVSGQASVNFAGYLLGNPVTGSYEVRTDCKIVWSLQDDSGTFQHFAGTLTPDLQRAGFSQTDPGGAQRGTLAKAPAGCSAANLRGTYDLAISGSSVPMNPGDGARKISANEVLFADGAGNLMRLNRGMEAHAGTATVDSDCIVNLTLTFMEPAPIKLRGILVDGGREILAIEADPGATVNARIRAR